MPEDDKQLLRWDFVVRQMEQAKHYWISTVNLKSEPHVVPLWGIWFGNRVHFDGSPKTAWAINLVQNPKIAVHLPDGKQVVIVYGTAHMLEDNELDEHAWNQLDSAYQVKYQVQEGSPYWHVEPRKVIAWDGEYLNTMTRWLFE